MRASDGSSIPPPLRRAADRFSRWRDQHELGTRIPTQLWELAAELAANYGVSRTATALKLDYYSLKRRVSDLGTPPVLPTVATDGSAFVELPASTLSAPAEYLIELENSQGDKMRILCKGMAPDVVALSRGFWGAD